MVARIGRWAVCIALALATVACGGGEGDATPTAASTLATGAASAPASEPAGDQPDAGGGERDTYTVRSGDTLSAIARKLDTTVEALVEANDITDPDVIDVGQELKVPSP